jgi:hypothetical protein
LVIQFVDFVVLFNGLFDDTVVLVAFGQALVILSEQELVLGRALDGFDGVGLEIEL